MEDDLKKNENGRRPQCLGSPIELIQQQKHLKQMVLTPKRLT